MTYSLVAPKSRPGSSKGGKDLEATLQDIAGALQSFQVDSGVWTRIHSKCFYVANAMKTPDGKPDPYCSISSLQISMDTTLSSHSDKILQLAGDEADAFMCLIQTILDMTPTRHASRGIFMKTLIEMAIHSQVIPRSLDVDDITDRSEFPVSAGGFGDVWKADWRGRTVALKSPRTLSLLKDSDRAHKNFCREVLLWRQLRHPHLLEFLGVCRSLLPYTAIVSPWMDHGTVLTYVREHSEVDRLCLLRQIASALAYLHEQEPPVVHQDVRGVNILVNDKQEAVLGDFGLSRIDSTIYESMVSTLQHGCTRWQAPELLFPLDGKPKASSATDIWSFGMVILELFTESLPFAKTAVDSAVVIDLFHGRQPERPEVSELKGKGLSDQVWLSVKKCWERNPSDRPRASDLCDQLRDFDGSSMIQNTLGDSKKWNHNSDVPSQKAECVVKHVMPPVSPIVNKLTDTKDTPHSQPQPTLPLTVNVQTQANQDPLPTPGKSSPGTNSPRKLIKPTSSVKDTRSIALQSLQKIQESKNASAPPPPSPMSWLKKVGRVWQKTETKTGENEQHPLTDDSANSEERKSEKERQPDPLNESSEISKSQLTHDVERTDNALPAKEGGHSSNILEKPVENIRAQDESPAVPQISVVPPQSSDSEPKVVPTPIVYPVRPLSAPVPLKLGENAQEDISESEKRARSWPSQDPQPAAGLSGVSPLLPKDKDTPAQSPNRQIRLRPKPLDQRYKSAIADRPMLISRSEGSGPPSPTHVHLPSNGVLGPPKNFVRSMSQPGPSNSKETSLDPQHVAHDLTKIEKSKFPEPETQINSKNLNASAASTTRFNDIPERKTLIMRDEGTEPFHFQLGTCVGYGQFGGVYRALNLHSGQVVAVKSISLGRYSEAEIQQLMREVRAAKKLNHPTIVTYEIMCRENDILNIVQEFAESGSLAQTIKAFGKLSEHLVHGYAVKILEGLDYLHQSGVAHCNLKASNIFCTKNGNIKLSDFGLSLNVRQKFLESTIDVPGAPNWMAPEVIELKGASRESDIWSFACTIIELLTGNPPYSNLRNSMVVMFWVVEDPMPIIPEDCSERLQDFLRICFQKDPTKRPTVEQLSRHDWLRTPSTPLRGNPQGDIPFARRIGQKSASADPPRYQRDIRRRPVIEDLSTSPPVPIAYALGRTKEAVNDASNPQQHKFVLTTFSSKTVTCRVCVQVLKRQGRLCEDCGLVAHINCAPGPEMACSTRERLPFSDPLKPTRANSRTADIQRQIDDTVGMMRDNINKMAQRGERLDSLQVESGGVHVGPAGAERRNWRTNFALGDRVQPTPPKGARSSDRPIGRPILSTMNPLASLTAAKGPEQYTTLEKLGVGTCGAVFKSIRTDTKKMVLMRRIDLSDALNNAEALRRDIQQIMRFHSKYVPEYLQYVVEGKALRIITEYFDGVTCNDLITAKVFSEPQIAVICREILLGLETLHANGIAHRNLKAANVLITSSGDVKLLDFGLFSALKSVWIPNLAEVPFWTAPEVIRQVEQDAKVDIWSLGMTLIELAHGKPPWTEYHPARVKFLIPKAKPPVLAGDFSQNFKDFVAACLIKDPKLRRSGNDLCNHGFIRDAPATVLLAGVVQRVREHKTNLSRASDSLRRNNWSFESVDSSTSEFEVVTKGESTDSLTTSAHECDEDQSDFKPRGKAGVGVIPSSSNVQATGKKSEISPSSSVLAVSRRISSVSSSRDETGRYTILETLGTGNFGTVFKGIHNESKQIVVVRQIELGGSKDRALKIQQDIELMSQCKSKHLLRYQECFVNDDTLWIIIEYVNGTSCKDLLKASTMSEGNIAAICRELITGLDCLHSEEKIHQNVKASNVIVTSLGEVKLTDGGISSSLLVNPRQTIVGTPFWTAPEAIRQAEFGAKSDIWSLGITAIELAKGEPPLADYHPMRVMFLIPKAKPPSLDGDFSDAFKDFVALCLRKEPDNRPSAKELLQHSFIKNAPTTRRLRELLEPSQLYLGRPPERIQKYDMGSSHSSGLKPIKAVRTDSPERETYGCRPATPISFQNPITERSTEGTLRWNSPKAVDADMHTDGTNDAALVEMTRDIFLGISGKEQENIDKLREIHHVGIIVTEKTTGTDPVTMTLTGEDRNIQRAKDEISKLVEFQQRFGNLSQS